ncbi:hypothetical protein [Bradyrhizobium sp. USDA 10063]
MVGTGIAGLAAAAYLINEGDPSAASQRAFRTFSTARAS